MVSALWVLNLSSCTPQGAWKAIEDQYALVQEGRIWQYRRAVQLNASGIEEDLIDVPVLVHLTPSRISYDKVRTDQRDIRFILPDGRTELAHEVELWNPSGDSYIWVRIPMIEAGSNTTAFYIYYGNRDPKPAPPPSLVWSNGYVAVFHLSESTPPYRDSSPNALLGQVGDVPAGNSLIPPDSAAGFIGRGISYADPAAGFFIYPSDTIANIAPLSIMMMVDIAAYGSNQHFINKDKWFLRSRNAGGGELRFQAFMDGSGDFYRDVSAGSDLSSRSWTSYTVVWEETTNISGLSILIDGAAPNPVTSSSSTGPRQDDAADALVVGNTRWAVDALDEAFFDEVRISSVVRSSDWIALQELSLRDSLLGYGSEELLEY